MYRSFAGCWRANRPFGSQKGTSRPGKLGPGLGGGQHDEMKRKTKHRNNIHRTPRGLMDVLAVVSIALKSAYPVDADTH